MSGAVTAAAVGSAALGLGATAATAAAVGIGAGSMIAQSKSAKKQLGMHKARLNKTLQRQIKNNPMSVVYGKRLHVKVVGDSPQQC